MDSTLLGAWWQVWAIGSTGVIAGGIAFWGILTQRAIARRSLTLTYMAKVDTDKDMIAARQIFITQAKKPEGLTPWATDTNQHCPECEAIRLVLNDFELASVGIQLGTLDYEFYKRYNRGTVIRYWYAAAPFVYAIRSSSGVKSVYHEFEELARGFETGRPPRRWFRFRSLR